MISRNKKKLISCIVPNGRAAPVLKALRDEHGIVNANIINARGTGRMTPLAWRGVGESTEKDIMYIVVDEGVSEEIFEFIYREAGIDQPHGGIIFQRALIQSTEYSLPDLPYEED